MAELTKKNIEKLADLADIKLTSDEVDALQPELSAVIDFFDELKNLSTDSVHPTSQTTGLENVLRSDSIDTTRILPVEKAVREAHSVHNDYFVVGALLDVTKNQS